MNASLVADYFIYRSKRCKDPLRHLKLQKLLYYAQAWYLVFHKKKLFKDRIEAWVHGPAVEDIWHRYKIYTPLLEREIDLDKIKKIPPMELEILKEVWRVYGNKTDIYLELLTHSEQPWIRTRDGISMFDASHKSISPKLMLEFYSKLLKKMKNAK